MLSRALTALHLGARSACDVQHDLAGRSDSVRAGSAQPAWLENRLTPKAICH
jgi:hypothetical protein